MWFLEMNDITVWGAWRGIAFTFDVSSWILKALAKDDMFAAAAEKAMGNASSERGIG